jgi:protein-tyrosine-phosphatase/DNA-binding transcriptional ArsR family regulator
VHEASAEALAALGQSTRLSVFRLLARRCPGTVAASEIAAALGVMPNTLSTHLDILVRNRLIERERHGRSILYCLDIEGAAALIGYLAADCCRGRPDICAVPAEIAQQPAVGAASATAEKQAMTLLFICTGNSARSIIAEAIMNDTGNGRFRAFSAGTHARSEPDPRALMMLRKNGYDIDGLRSKSLAEFQGPDAPALDFVITVCDRSANEECPPWPGQPLTGHWGVPDPVKVQGTEAEIDLALDQAFRMIRDQIASFAALPIETLDRVSVQQRIDQIGRSIEGPLPMA